MNSTLRATSVPSRFAPVFARTVQACRLFIMVMSSSRLKVILTGRPDAMASAAVTGWLVSSHLPPNPPPTRGAITRTFDIGSPSARAVSICTRATPCMDDHRVTLPLESTSARVETGSRYMWYWAGSRYSFSTTASHSGQAMSGSPSWNSE